MKCLLGVCVAVAVTAGFGWQPPVPRHCAPGTPVDVCHGFKRAPNPCPPLAATCPNNTSTGG